MIQPMEKMVSEEIKRLVPVLGKDNAERISRTYLLSDVKTRQRIFEMLDTIKAAVMTDKELSNTILMEPPPRDVAMDGDIKLGSVVYGKKKLYPFFIDKESLLTHMAIFGSSGYGKTNISYSLISSLSESGVPVIVFDFSKRNYRDLLSTPLRDRIEIYTIGRPVAPFRFNPLVPPEGVQKSQWIKEFASIFDHAYWLLGGGRHIIIKALDEVYKSKETPTLSDLKEWIERYGETHLPARERNWISTAERPLESLCFRELGKVFECEKGLDIEGFFEPGKITVIELDALDTNDKTFVIEIMLQWIRNWLLSRNERETLKGVVILEEAHHVLNREKSKKIGSETVMDTIFREVRELGLGIVYLDQHPSLVSYPALGNTSTHIYMNLGLDTKHSSDIQDAASMLGLKYEEEGNYLRKIPIGQGFVLRRGFSFNDPFVVAFDKFSIKKGIVRDEDIRTLMSGKLDIVQENRTEKDEKQHYADVEKLGSEEWKIVNILGQGDGVFASEIYKALGMSGSMFNKRIRQLEDLGVVGTVKAKIKRSTLKYIFLTEKGERFFEMKFGNRKESTSDIDTDRIVEMFSIAGWRCTRHDDVLICTTKGHPRSRKTLKIYLKKSPEPEGKRIADGRTYLCANERVRNRVIQKAAEFSKKNSENMTIFIATVKEFEEKGGFERIDFVAERSDNA